MTTMIKNEKPRDISHFLQLRVARMEDERVIGELLIRSFEQTYRTKLPSVVTNQARKIELLDVASRRRQGVVYVLELGYRIIGTFALIPSNDSSTQSWVAGATNLRCLAIDPDFHGYGFSETLLSEAERVARNWNARAICLHVQKGAEGVARLYEKYGFVRSPEGDMSSFGNENEGYVLYLENAKSNADSRHTSFLGLSA